MRAFLAIEIDDHLKEVLSGLVEKLAAQGAGISWVRPEQMHLTLWFFEDLAEERLEDVSGVVLRAARGIAPFSLEIRKTGSFGGSHPRVFWCGFAGGTDSLNRLYSTIEDGFRGIGIRGDGKPFRAHLTLGRNRSGSRQERVSTLLRSLSDYPVGRFRVAELTLFRSTLGPGGAVHTPLARFPLEGQG